MTEAGNFLREFHRGMPGYARWRACQGSGYMNGQWYQLGADVQVEDAVDAYVAAAALGSESGTFWLVMYACGLAEKVNGKPGTD